MLGLRPPHRAPRQSPPRAAPSLLVSLEATHPRARTPGARTRRVQGHPRRTRRGSAESLGERRGAARRTAGWRRGGRPPAAASGARHDRGRPAPRATGPSPLARARRCPAQACAARRAAALRRTRSGPPREMMRRRAAALPPRRAGWQRRPAAARGTAAVAPPLSRRPSVAGFSHRTPHKGRVRAAAAAHDPHVSRAPSRRCMADPNGRVNGATSPNTPDRHSAGSRFRPL